MNVKISVFVICVEAIIYLLLYNLRDCTFNSKMNLIFRKCNGKRLMRKSRNGKLGNGMRRMMGMRGIRVEIIFQVNL